jgi:hypothetical protein
MWKVLSSNAVTLTWTRVQYAELQQVPAMLQKGALGMVLTAQKICQRQIALQSAQQRDSLPASMKHQVRR